MVFIYWQDLDMKLEDESYLLQEASPLLFSFSYVRDLCVSWHQKLFEKHPFIENADPILGNPHSWAI